MEYLRVLEARGSVPIQALQQLKGLDILIVRWMPGADEADNLGLFASSERPPMLRKLRYVIALSLGTVTSRHLPNLQGLELVSICCLAFHSTLLAFTKFVRQSSGDLPLLHSLRICDSGAYHTSNVICLWKLCLKIQFLQSRTGFWRSACMLLVWMG